MNIHFVEMAEKIKKSQNYTDGDTLIHYVPPALKRHPGSCKAAIRDLCPGTINRFWHKPRISLRSSGVTVILFVIVCFLTATPAYAACLGPAGIAGDIIYNTNEHVPQYCDGTNWIAFTALAGDGGAGCTGPVGVEGDLTFNPDIKVMQYCEGDEWVSIGTCGDYNSGSLGHWPLNEGSGTSTADISGNGNNGTFVNSPTWQTSGGRTWLNFNGTSDYVTTSSLNAYDSYHTGTISAWIRTDGALPLPDSRSFVAYSAANSLISIMDWRVIFDTGVLAQTWKINGGGGNWAGIHGSTDVTDGLWHHVAFVADGVNRVKIYLDGVEETTTYIEDHANGEESDFIADTDYIETQDNAIRIGARVRSTIDDYFDGDIDDVRIYDRALTGEEIEKIYKDGLRANMDAAKVGHWPLDEASGGLADTTSNKNHGVPGGNPTYNPSGGRVNGALDFDGADDIVTVSHNGVLDNLDTITIALWVKTNSMGEGNLGRLLDKTFGFNDFIMYLAATNKYLFGANRWATDYGAWSSPNDSIAFSRWQHVVMTYDYSSTANNAQFYLDGSPVTTSRDNAPAGSVVSGAGDLLIGNKLDLSRTFDGMIDDVRIYNRVLSEEEIALLYNDTAPGYGCAKAGSILYNTDHNLMQYCDGAQWIAIGQDCQVVGTGLVGHWKLDETSGTNASDSTTYNNDGTLTNMDPATDWVAGILDGALDFDGSNDYVDIPNIVSNFASSDWTFSVWVRHDALVTDNTFGGQQPIFSSRTGTNGAPYIYLVLRDSTYLLRYIASTNDGYVTAPQAPGEWVHLVGVYSGRDLTIYKDGVFSQSATLTADRVNLSSTGIYLGEGYNLTPFNGLIDDVRVYNRALSAAEIEALSKFTAPPSVTQPAIVNKGYVAVNANQATYTLSNYTVADDANRILVVTVHGENNGAGATGVTFGGTAMTLAKEQSTSQRSVQMWYLLNPAATTADIVATYASGPGVRSAVTALTLVNVAQQAPEVTVGYTSTTATTVNDDITTLTDTAIVISAATEDENNGASGVTQGPGQIMIETQRWGTGTGFATSYKIVPYAGTATLGYTWPAAADQARVLASFAVAP